MKTRQAHKWNIADTVTASRIALSLVLLFMPLRSVWFLAVYTLTGLTDASDGYIARKSGTVSDFGARLDSVADFSFFGVLMLKALPVVYSEMPEGIWYGVCAVLVVRLTAYAVGALRYRRFAALHTWLNKLTGGAIFLLPYALVFSYGTGYLRIVCALALLAAVEELAMNIRFKEYRADRKSIFLTGEKNENT